MALLCEFNKNREEIIESYFAGELSAEEMEKLEQHIFRCLECLQEFTFQEELVHLVQEERVINPGSVTAKELSPLSKPVFRRKKRILKIIPLAAIAVFFMAVAAYIAMRTVWVVSGGGGGTEPGSWGLAVDRSENTIITGRFEGLATFGSQTLESVSAGDIFVARYNYAGELLWIKQIACKDPAEGQGGLNIGLSVTTDRFNNIFLTGEFVGEAVFDSTVIRCQGALCDLFIAKLDSNGLVQWARSANATYSISGYDIAVDEQGNCIVAGNFGHHNLGGAATFDDVTLTTFGGNDIFVAKYGPQGSLLWAKQAGAAAIPASDVGRSVVTDSEGNIFVGGQFNGVARFDSFTVSSAGGNDIFLAKYNQDGQVLWVKGAGGNGRDECFAITQKGSDIFVTGFFSGSMDMEGTVLYSGGERDIFVAAYNNSGVLTWANQVFTTGNLDGGRGVTADNNGNVFVTGQFNGQAIFGEALFNSSGDLDIIVAAFSPLGDALAAVSFGGKGQDVGMSIAAGANGDIFLTGSFQDTVRFQNARLISAGGLDIFILRLDVNQLTPVANVLWMDRTKLILAEALSFRELRR